MTRPLHDRVGSGCIGFALVISCFSFVVSFSARAAPPTPTATPTAPGTATPTANPSASPRKAWSSCTEYIPDGAARPKMEAHFPQTGVSGHELRLIIIVTHGSGETVLPAGFHLERSSDAMRAIEQAQFHIPDEGGPSAPTIDRPKDSAGGKAVTTTLSLPFLALPDKPGRHQLTLPPLPIAIGRANGQVMTLCTEPKAVTIEDPIANAADPKVKPNPPPRPQREEWILAKQAFYAALAVVALAALGAWLLYRWSRRPRPAPVTPMVPPWLAALREIEAIGAALLDLGAEPQPAELVPIVDRINDCVRRYLGDRYGFDGIESTSEEIGTLLLRVYPPVPERGAIATFLDDTDLVKFAKVAPAPQDCRQFLARAEHIVQRTLPPNAQAFEQAAERRAA